jgi:fucose permease
MKDLRAPIVFDLFCIIVFTILFVKVIQIQDYWFVFIDILLIGCILGCLIDDINTWRVQHVQ